MAREDFRFFHPLRVRWAEADMQGIVFNGHYLTYFDVAFTEYWRAIGLPGPLLQAQAGQEMFARKATVEYLSPARFDDVLDIGVRCAAFVAPVPAGDLPER
jgi:acyl-CoA thioester hydrolase